MSKAPSEAFVFCLFVCFCCWPRRMASGVLVPRPGIEPGPLVVKVLSPNHWTAREFPQRLLLIKMFDHI